MLGCVIMQDSLTCDAIGRCAGAKPKHGQYISLLAGYSDAMPHGADCAMRREPLDLGAAAVNTLSFVSSRVRAAKGGYTLASSVLPTPVGPRNMKPAIGRFGSDRPTRDLQNAIMYVHTVPAVYTASRMCVGDRQANVVDSPVVT